MYNVPVHIFISVNVYIYILIYTHTNHFGVRSCEVAKFAFMRVALMKEPFPEEPASSVSESLCECPIFRVSGL